ncbi:hypothetical protein B0H13DRAFT_2261028 [Mycena leptocephala]|nr:hypothetical protein B0H13DRAFT_2261028 [Mycena leptocephala]
MHNRTRLPYLQFPTPWAGRSPYLPLLARGAPADNPTSNGSYVPITYVSRSPRRSWARANRISSDSLPRFRPFGTCARDGQVRPNTVRPAARRRLQEGKPGVSQTHQAAGSYSSTAVSVLVRMSLQLRPFPSVLILYRTNRFNTENVPQSPFPAFPRLTMTVDTPSKLYS